MYDIGIEKALDSCKNIDNNRYTPAIGEKIYRCRDCDSEFHKLIYYPYDTPTTAYENDYKYHKGSRLMFKKSIKDIDVENELYKSYSSTELKQIINNMINEVTTFNTRNGFTESGIKININKVMKT